MSSGHLCEAEAPTETTVETRKSESILSYGELFQRSNRQILPKRRAQGDTKQALSNEIRAILSTVSHQMKGMLLMSIIFIRSLILYFLVIFAVRLMGKRQLGELQPSELVITILVSNIATLPIEDSDIPVILGITPILSLVCFEVIVSWLSLKFPKLRKMISGSPKIIIRGGKTDPQVMKELRFSVDDLLTSLRGKDIFDISEVQYAVVETTGNVSVMKKQADDTPVRKDLGLEPHPEDPPQLVVADGKIIDMAVKSLGYDEQWVRKTLDEGNKKLSEVLIMMADRTGRCYIAGKDGGAPYIREGDQK